MNEHTGTTKKWPFDSLQKITNNIVGISIICYLAGFVVTNMYLGSLGIVHLDLLKARYIISGFLFILFLSAIAYLIYGLILTLRKYQEKKPILQLFNAFWFSFLNIGLVYLITHVLAILSGSFTNPPIGLPHITPILDISIWLQEIPIKIFSQTVIFYSLFVVMVISIIIIITLINPKDKDGSKSSRSQVISDILSQIWHNKQKVITYFLGFFIFIFLWFLISDFLTFMFSYKDGNLSNNRIILHFSGWIRYFIGIVSIYLFPALFILLTFFSPRSSKENPTNDEPLERSNTLIYLVTFALMITVPVYILGIYPNLPQQIGGGQMISVDVSISNYTINADFSNKCNEVFIIDRTPNTTLFLILNSVTKTRKFIEIPAESIMSIIYDPPASQCNTN